MNREVFAFDVNEELRKIRANSDQAKISTVSRISSTSSVNSQFPAKDKVDEIKKLIRKYAQYWGESEENIEEYIEDQLASFPLDDLINCFRSLNADIKHLR